MIAADTSSLVAYFAGAPGDDVVAIDEALSQHALLLPPVVLSELLSAPKLSKALEALLLAIPLLSITDGYWVRTAKLRARLLARRYKARLADALIAQSCLDHHVALITRDRDFRHFAGTAALRVLP